MSAAVEDRCLQPAQPWPRDMSREELRAELQQALTALATASQQVEQLNACLQELASELAAIVVPHLRGDGAGVYGALARLTAKRVKLVCSTAAGEGLLQ